MGAAETAPLFKSHRRKAGHAGAFTLCKTDSLDKHYNLAQAIRSVPRDTLVVPARGTTYAKYGGGHPPFLRRQSFGAPDPRVQKAAGCRSGRDAAGGIRQGWTSHRRLRRHGSLCADRTVATAARFRRYRAVLRFGGEFPRRASIVERLVCGTADGVRSGEDG